MKNQGGGATLLTKWGWFGQTLIFFFKKKKFGFFFFEFMKIFLSC